MALTHYGDLSPFALPVYDAKIKCLKAYILIFTNGLLE